MSAAKWQTLHAGLSYSSAGSENWSVAPLWNSIQMNSLAWLTVASYVSMTDCFYRSTEASDAYEVVAWGICKATASSGWSWEELSSSCCWIIGCQWFIRIRYKATQNSCWSLWKRVIQVELCVPLTDSIYLLLTFVLLWMFLWSDNIKGAVSLHLGVSLWTKIIEWFSCLG